MAEAFPSHYVVFDTGYEDNLDDCIAGGNIVKIGSEAQPRFQQIIDEIENLVGACGVIFSTDSFDYDVIQNLFMEIKDWSYCNARSMDGTVKHELSDNRKLMVVSVDAEAG